MTPKILSDYDQAYKDKQRVFYSSYTDTIRSCPENYLLAIRSDTTKRFLALGDPACKKYFAKIQKAINSGNNHLGGASIAAVVARLKAVPGSFRNHGYDVWQ